MLGILNRLLTAARPNDTTSLFDCAPRKISLNIVVSGKLTSRTPFFNYQQKNQLKNICSLIFIALSTEIYCTDRICMRHLKVFEKYICRLRAAV